MTVSLVNASIHDSLSCHEVRTPVQNILLSDRLLLLLPLLLDASHTSDVFLFDMFVS